MDGNSRGGGGDGGGKGICDFCRGLMCCSSFFEYETPKVVTIQNVPLGILRLMLQLCVIAFVVVYQLWYARGYQVQYAAKRWRDWNWRKKQQPFLGVCRGRV